MLHYTDNNNNNNMEMCTCVIICSICIQGVPSAVGKDPVYAVRDNWKLIIIKMYIIL